MPFWSKDNEGEAGPRPTEAPREKTPAPRAEPPKKEKTMARDDRQTGEINALLGRGATFEGKLTFEGTVRVDGTFKGEIFTDEVLVVGEGAKIEAEIKVGTLVVNGEIKGNIIAKQAVELHHPAKVFGNITTPSLIIDRGVIFEGSSKMQNLERPGEGRPTPAAAGAPAPAKVEQK
jgi:cytoskeletal protein CcmA (bactofilin family)